MCNARGRRALSPSLSLSLFSLSLSVSLLNLFSSPLDSEFLPKIWMNAKIAFRVWAPFYSRLGRLSKDDNGKHHLK